MFKTIRKLLYFLTVFLMVLPLVACSGGGSDTVGSSGGSGPVGTTGFLDISKTDAPGDYLNFFVTIKAVEVKPEVGKRVLLTDLNLPQTFDLLSLQNGVIAPLGDGAVALEAGHYNWMRLILTEDKPASHPYANYLIIEGESEPTELRVLPSELKNGIKIVQGFDIEVAGSTELILDFNADKSVVQANGKKGWHVKPTVKVLETVKYSVSGVVEDGASAPLNGASISAQIYDSGAADPKDEIIAGPGATTALIDGVDGSYFMYLPITHDSFNIVATMEGYLPECQVLDAEKNTDGTKVVRAYEEFDLTLTAADATGTFIGSLTGLEESAESAHFSIRQAHTACGMIEVASASVIKTLAPAETEYFTPVILPVGIYEVVVSGYEEDEEGTQVWEETQVWEIEVSAGNTTVLDVYFPTPSVYGIVYDGADVPLPGATISAQEYDDTAAFPELEVTEIDDTSSDSNGAYYMYLPDRPLNVVASMESLEPQCTVVTELTEHNINFTLVTPVDGTGTISGSVTGMALTDTAIISIRQASCGKIELASASGVLNEGTFGPVIFPVGAYEVVVSAEGYTTQAASVNVLGDTETQVNVVLIPTP